ncbi:uncharacterized protein LOC132728666 isoform X2 [Ruditapes philippinarum]|uniref:uncharacterized protein LOC132728666 isoform X2 n=1 Tax=Ruditapes philippinarum TaxID=129788 RepID=UPI00295C1A3A|nr:uncharacterized protein LOC132728666 isoform X2 [Ruditapes philippinarum]
MALRDPVNTQLSVDSDPVAPLDRYVEQNHIISLSSRNDVSADAMAGPQDARRRSTRELKADAKEAAQHDIEKLPAKSSSGSRSRNELDQIESEIYKRVDSLNLSKGRDSSYSSMSSMDSLSCSSMPSADWEEELKQYENSMPPDIRLEYIDVLILYCEEDRKEAQKFQKHLREEIPLSNGPIKTLLYDDSEMQAISASMIGHLEKVVQRSTYVFIFMTKNFIDDKWCEFSSESCLMEAITNPLKQWCVVPVYTEKRNTSFRVPMGLNTLKGINYYNNDRFYKNGVARLIGDKIYVRIKANEEHKIKQKKWLEEHKREQAVLKEKQRRVEETQKAMTQQLLDWLDKETRRLIHAGILPDFLPHSSSESEISSHASSIPHSSSSNSLKPIHPQSPAVAAYFQDLLAQQKQYNWNSNNYSPQQVRIIEQVYGGYGHFPPGPSSASYNQNYHHVKRSTSQTSADMGPSAEFVLRTETGDFPVSVPSVLIDKIKNEPEDKKQMFVIQYLEEFRKQQLQVNQSEVASQNRAASNPGSRSQEVPYNSQTQSNPGILLPNFHDLSLHSDRTSIPANSSIYSQPLQTGVSGHDMSSQNPTRPSLRSNYMDGNSSNFPGGGNIPNQSLLEQDAGSSLESSRNQSMSSRQEHVYQTAKSTVKETQSDSGSDDESPKNKKKSKGKGKQVVHIHKTYIYQPGTVQIGDHNVVQEQGIEQENSEGEDGESFSKVSQLPYTDTKTMNTDNQHNSNSEEKQKMKKVEIETGSETHGEMQDQPGSSGASSSCNVDAAPSTVNKLHSTISEKYPATQKKSTPGGLKMKEEIEEAQEVFPDEKNIDSVFNSVKKFENSSKFDESCEHGMEDKNSQFEGSVNFNSSSSEKSSSLKRKEIPTGESTPMKQTGSPRPVAAVSPFSPKVNDDDSDDNCDNTDPKTVVHSKLSGTSESVLRQGEDTEQTYVKLAWQPTSQKQTEQFQRNSPVQLLTKARVSDNSSNGAFTRAKFTDPQNLFFSKNNACKTVYHHEEGKSGKLRQEVTLGTDPLSRETQEGMVESYGTPV